ncbi:hypothetical protein F5Y18DRAFT_427762 [Xylariaceae sp. FL1019]|nr:hypothetical protein F5Y18DRAFT_427762 [Xylariaceae sp. FL1019]
MSSSPTASGDGLARDPPAAPADYFDEKITSVWIAQAKKSNPHGYPQGWPTGWAIAFFTEAESIIAVHPRNMFVRMVNCEMVLWSPQIWRRDESHGDQGITLLQRLTDMTDTQLRLGAVEDATYNMILRDDFGRAGFNSYELRDGRGLRFWLFLTITVIQHRFKPEEGQESITRTALARRIYANLVIYVWGEKTDVVAGTLDLRHGVRPTGKNAWYKCLDELAALQGSESQSSPNAQYQ